MLLSYNTYAVMLQVWIKDLSYLPINIPTKIIFFLIDKNYIF